MVYYILYIIVIISYYIYTFLYLEPLFQNDMHKSMRIQGKARMTRLKK